MHRRLRHDLEWTAAPRQDGALLRDPVTARTFALSSAQAEILRAAARYPDLATAAQRVSEILGAEISPALIDALLAVFADLALLASDLGPAQIHERQRDARRRFFAESRLEKLQATLTTMRELPYYARLLPTRPRSTPSPTWRACRSSARPPCAPTSTNCCRPTPAPTSAG